MKLRLKKDWNRGDQKFKKGNEIETGYRSAVKLIADGTAEEIKHFNGFIFDENEDETITIKEEPFKNKMPPPVFEEE